MKKLNFSRDRMAESRDIRERWYNGEKTERTPFMFSVPAPVSTAWFAANPYNFEQLNADADLAVEAQILAIQHQFDTFPDCDYLPCMQLHYMGEGILASLYGAEQLVVKDDPPFTKGRLFKDIYDTQNMGELDIDSEWGRKLKEHVMRFVDATDGQIPVGPPDYQSPYGTATKLMPNEDLMLAMYDEPELVHAFLNRVTDGIIQLLDIVERWVGLDLLARNQSNAIPNKHGLIIWDDYISVVSPALHQEFCAPCNIRLFERFGYGHLHSCGPYFPSYVDSFLACSPRSMDVSIMRGMGKTRQDMMDLLAIASERGIRLFGGLDINDVHIFDGNSKKPDDAMIEAFILGGWFPNAGGTAEEGDVFRAKIKAIDARRG